MLVTRCPASVPSGWLRAAVLGADARRVCAVLVGLRAGRRTGVVRRRARRARRSMRSGGVVLWWRLQSDAIAEAWGWWLPTGG